MNSSSPGSKVGKDSHQIRKPPLPLPQVQYRPPIIIHTHSPKTVHTQPHYFKSLVQKLTGSSDTRLHLKKDKAPSSSTKNHKQASVSTSRKETSDAAILERQGSGGSSTATVTNCGSPSSSEDLATFLVTEQSGHGGGEARIMKQSNSPRSPFDSNYEVDTAGDPLSHFVDASAGGTMFNLQVKAEPMFSFYENINPFTFFSDFMQHPALQQPASKPAPQMHQHPDLMSLQMHQHPDSMSLQMHQHSNLMSLQMHQHPDLMSPYLNNHY